MQYALGLFVFSLNTAAPQSVQTDAKQRFGKQDPINDTPQYQNIGIGEKKKNFNGVLYPSLTGGLSNIALLETMMNSGEAYVLVDGRGIVHGRYIIDSVSYTESDLFNNGLARKIVFQISLIRIDNKALAHLGNFIDDVVSDIFG